MTLKIIPIAVLASLAAAGCGQSGESSTTADRERPGASTVSTTATNSSVPAAGASAPLVVTVHRSEGCSCCSSWVAYLRRNGFRVNEHATNNLDPIKERAGVPHGKEACHTAEVAGYFIEGHVPARDIRRLLTERPDAKGLTVPGMPAGSPGMETPTGKVQPYDVLLVTRDGSTTVFSHHGD